MRGLFALLVAGIFTSMASAQRIAIGNLNTKPVAFEISAPTAEKNEVRKFELGPLENRAINVGQEPEIAFTFDGATTRYRLDPFTAYIFADVDGKMTFQGIEMQGKLPGIADIPKAPVEAKPGKIAVKVCVDQHESRTADVTKKIYEARIRELSEILEKQTGLTLEMTGFAEWQSEVGDDLFAGLREFERKVKAEPGVLIIGFSPKRPDKPMPGGPPPGDAVYSMSRGPFSTHLIIRDGTLRGDAEKQEVVLQELGHWLGAAHSPDPLSAMRLKLGDGKANSARFRLQYDPLNLLAVNIWAKQRRAKELKSWLDIPAVDRERLEVIYKTMSQLCPEDTISQEHLAVLDRIKKDPAEAANLGPKSAMPKLKAPDPAPAPPVNAKIEKATKAETVRTVLLAMRAKATEWQKLPANDRPKGDLLTAELIRAAADSAMSLPEDQRLGAFLVALGIGLDDSMMLRNNPLTRALCQAAESDVERADRIKVLGTPTVRNRHDLCQHFAISVTLAELYGPGPAELAGVAKEVSDMNGPSGFSFVDLTADLAGIAMAERLKKDPALLAKWREKFPLDDYVPSMTGLREGLSPKRFEADFGNLEDPRFKAQVEALRKRVQECPGYKP